MKLTAKSQYAIAAMVNLKKRSLKSKKGDTITLQSISDDEKISLQYLEQIFGNLRKAKIVKSVRGPGGGYLLVKPLVSYMAIIEAVNEKVELCNDLDSKKGSGSSEAFSELLGIESETISMLSRTFI